ncbi:hypothetical protein K488DRAFT_80778 [Vararia minispora EC-137]|uniref:Uncharacterized protein n=1 Tax=Vararia minispora EC-137 TaxID=1314806 RepID=A0ACB8Q942_9AGAM|nr:hypothetical protein K488DRAFT_80778 [Vararia minispora EC-137]
MYMPKARGFRYIVVARDDLLRVSEGPRALCEFFWEQIYCRYGVIEQAVLKASAAFFANRITVTRSTGYSSYYLLHGCHPTLPLDLAEMTFLGPFYNSHMSTSDLLAHRIRQLAKLPEDIKHATAILKTHRLHSKEVFERKFHKRMVKEEYLTGTLILVRNTTPSYLGPFRVVLRTFGGSYILCKVDSAELTTRFAAFRIIPYISRNDEDIRQLNTQEMENSGDEFFEPPVEMSTDSCRGTRI